MERTPIKIVGKNFRDGSKAAVLARKALNRPRGRPLKLESPKTIEGPATSSVHSRTSKMRTMKNIKSRRRMSYLEKLPTEILENIFMLCLNFNLPNCSPIIGGKLSSEAVYTKVIIAAFHPNWQKDLGRLIAYNERGLETTPIVPDNSDFQSALLRCRWANLPVILRSMDVWRKTYAEDRTISSLSAECISYAHGWDHAEYDPMAGNLRDDFDYKDDVTSIVEIFDTEYAAFSTLISTAREDDYVEARYYNLYRHSLWPTCLDVAKGTQIPNSLLMGPWDEDSVKYLYWFARGSVQIDSVSSTSGEAALIGYKKAVVEGNIEVIDLLLRLGVANKFLDSDLIQFTLRHAPGNIDFLIILCILHVPNGQDMEEEISTFQDELDPTHDTAKLEALGEFWGCQMVNIDYENM